MAWTFEELIDGKTWFCPRPDVQYSQKQVEADLSARRAGRPFRYEILRETPTEIMFATVVRPGLPELDVDRRTFRWRRLGGPHRSA